MLVYQRVKSEEWVRGEDWVRQTKWRICSNQETLSAKEACNFKSINHGINWFDYIKVVDNVIWQDYSKMNIDSHFQSFSKQSIRSILRDDDLPSSLLDFPGVRIGLGSSSFEIGCATRNRDILWMVAKSSTKRMVDPPKSCGTYWHKASILELSSS